MIPKKIHFCWLSNDPYPNIINKCINSWNKILPDYEFIIWDTKSFDVEKNTWVRQAVESKKYAFAADYIRLYAIYNFGGIYLDSDVEVLKSFNNLLHLPYFIGSEGDGNIEAAVFGANKKCDWIGDCLKYYNKKSFIKKDGSYETLTLPNIMMNQISKSKVIHEISSYDLNTLKNEYSKNKLIMFNQDLFCAKNYATGVIKTTKRTYSIHHFQGSWLSRKQKFFLFIKTKLINLLGVQTIETIIKFLK